MVSLVLYYGVLYYIGVVLYCVALLWCNGVMCDMVWCGVVWMYLDKEPYSLRSGAALLCNSTALAEILYQSARSEKNLSIHDNNPQSINYLLS